MKIKIENDLKYKLIGIILYFIVSLAGLSIIFNFSPKNLLFNEDSTEDKYKLYFFKDFAKTIYENINKPFIKNITLTMENEECPNDFEILSIENEYYGHFNKFFGNRSFCIQRFNNSNYTYEKILKKNDDICDIGKKYCGKINNNSDIPLCLIDNDNVDCPINFVDFSSKGDNIYKIIDEKQAFVTSYSPSKHIIVDIEIINNYKLCLGKYNIENYNKNCSFYDNNECFIDDNHELIQIQNYPDSYKLLTENLIEWNFPNYIIGDKELCNKNITFHIFTVSYINFTYDNLMQFKEEFPSNDETNNNLYKICEIYKSSENNIPILFRIISFILICWSLVHFLLQIFLYFEIFDLKQYYIYNGLALFSIKLLSYFGMIIYHYCFFLKIKKVYLVLTDEYRNKVLDLYKSTRKSFIIKIFIFFIVGLIIIVIDFIIFLFSFNIIKELKNIKKEKPLINNEESKKINEDNKFKTNEPYIYNKYNEFKELPLNKNEREIDSNENMINININKSKKESNIDSKLDNITLQFICKEDETKTYLLKMNNNESFKNAIEKLKKAYSELQDKNMISFINESCIIDIEKSVADNGLSNNDQIIISSE